MRRKIKIRCQICQKETRNKYYCDNKCRSIGQKTGDEICCKICGKKFYRSKSDIKRKKFHCSDECGCISQGKWLKNLPKNKKPNWKGGPDTRICDWCGKIVYRWKTCRNKKCFCSTSCSGFYFGQFKVKKGKFIKCKVCGTEKYRIPSMIKNNYGNHCSSHCSALSNIKKQKKKNTDIEILLKDWLIENKIEFEPQKIIKGICCTDFFIKPNICLFADGDYWHSLPKRKELDEKQTKQLIQNNYIVLRLSGKDIKSGIRPIEILNLIKYENRI